MQAMEVAQAVAGVVAKHCTDVVMSPGSRNSPLAYALLARRDITVHMRIDERSAAFTALGLARVQRRHVAGVQRPREGRLIGRVVGIWRYRHLDQRQPRRGGLRVQHVAGHALHRSAAVVRVHRGQQADDVDLARLAQHVQCPRRVLATAP